jgi:hypothetical protein
MSKPEYVITFYSGHFVDEILSLNGWCVFASVNNRQRDLRVLSWPDIKDSQLAFN